MRNISRTAILCVLIFGNHAFSEQTPSHPFGVHDMLAMDRLSDSQVSPDGQWIVFVLRKTDLQANCGTTDLWLAAADGSSLRQLTTDPKNDSNPRWSPDGRCVWFLSDRSGSSQVWKIDTSGGEAWQVSRLPLDVANLLVSPDGKYIAFTIDVFPGSSPQQTKDKLEQVKNSKSSGRIYESLFIRHWDTWNNGTRSHIFVTPESGGPPVDIMADMDADSPSKPFGGPEEITFTPDGKGIVFTAKNVGRREAWSTNLDLFYCTIDGASKPACLTADNQAADTNPVFSPDGKTLAWLAMAKPNCESDRNRIVLKNWPDGKNTVLTEGWDRSPSSIRFGSDGRTIYATAENIGQKSLFAVDTATGKAATIVNDGTIDSFAQAGDRIIFEQNNLKSPAELYSAKKDGSDIRRITDINAGKIAAARMGDYEQFGFKGWNGETVCCYVVKPADFDASRKYPVALLIHGGPQGSFGNMFHYRWNPQVYAGAGFAAVMIDFHGSTGYGQAFTDSIRGDWGGKPLEDLQKGLDAALARYPWTNPRKVAALGASYGGYMINWIAGNWPDRFTCLVSHDGNLDERAAYYDTEELWFPECDHHGTPWDNPEEYEKQNPVNFVKNWKTPMLVIHGGRDFRVADTQGISTFTALQRRGIPSRLLYFPDENHWVLKPANSILWHETVIAWLNEWTK